ncbi:MAG: nucleotidyltransferase family protein [Sedimentisphaerales bacterium]
MICAIVLAAGCSSRMGTQKLLLPFGSGTVISHIVDQVLASKIKKVYVIVGHQPEMIEKELSGRPVEIIGNPKYKSGMLSSVRAGLRDIPENCDALLVVLGDQPSITSELIGSMIQTFYSSEKKIIVPLHNDKRGHPLLLSKIYRDEILTKYDEVGLRGILVDHDDDVFELSVSSPSVLLDMDYPEDYERELESQ